MTCLNVTSNNDKVDILLRYNVFTLPFSPKKDVEPISVDLEVMTCNWIRYPLIIKVGIDAPKESVSILLFASLWSRDV